MTNFLEQLAAEYYSHMGYFVRTNVKYGLRKKGGYEGEMDVVAFHPESLVLLHIETSMDADSWEKRKNKFQKKFSKAHDHYYKLFKFEIRKREKMVIVGFNSPRDDFWSIAPIKSIPDFVGEVTDYLSQFHPLNQAVPENYPLLRAMQFAIHYDKRLRNF
ncbi:MAG: hypothetical protein ABIG73_00895 [Patescibacteria group bacterium]